jgi:hypothetical protein
VSVNWVSQRVSQWDKPLKGQTFGEVTLKDFAAFDKAGLTHPDLSRMKQALGDLGGTRH